jgi:uncharacterized protein YqjF (DUF2071 family)
MTQTWHDLLFAHWPLPPEALRPLVPPELPLDTRDGAAWIGVVPFGMRDVRLRGLPGIPGASAFPEMNVRTYVTVGGKAGVWFFSLDAASLLAVMSARAAVGLPYYWARMSIERAGDQVRYESRRIGSGPPAAFAAGYGPTGPARTAAPGSLDSWLTDRYCLYTVRGGVIRRLEIDHPPWPLRPAAASFSRNEVALASGVALPDRPPLLHFADRLEVRFWAPVRIFSGE